MVAEAVTMQHRTAPLRSIATTLAAVAVVVLAACAPAAPAPAAPAQSAPSGATSQGAARPTAEWEQRWNAALTAAKQEGEINVYGPPGRDFREALVGPFERAYPGIKVTFTAGAGA